MPFTGICPSPERISLLDTAEQAKTQTLFKECQIRPKEARARIMGRLLHIETFLYLCQGMKKVSISQFWGRAWELFKVNWLPLVVLFLLYIGVSFIPFVGNLIAIIIFLPAFIRAGYLVARQGQVSFDEAFGDFGALIKVFVYYLLIGLLPGVLVGVWIVTFAAGEVVGAYRESSGILGAGSILVVAGFIVAVILGIFGWAGPYFIFSGKADIFGAIRQSFSLTSRHFGTVLLGILSTLGLVILGTIPCGLGLLVVGPMAYVFWPLMYLSLAEEA